MKAPRTVTNPCTGGVKLVLTPGPGTGNPVTFDGTSLEKTIPQASFSDGYEAFTLEGGAGGANQSQAPRDIKIEAKCLPAGNVIADYQFNVCAHPENFRVIQHPEENYVCEGKIGIVNQWLWDSDSEHIADLDNVKLLDQYIVSSLVIHNWEAHPEYEHHEHMEYQVICGKDRDNLLYNKDVKGISIMAIARMPAVDYYYQQKMTGHHRMKCIRCNTWQDMSVDQVSKKASWTCVEHFATSNNNVQQDGTCINRCDGNYEWHINKNVACPRCFQKRGECE